ncbi:hypothetical protein KFZ56_02390 [Virgibacillus sp. NKC19-3]|uniref:hypothetical protein n=1 Tax=Virgibacillus saliphilus TaxID=2831674 RepID=UPI001C9B0D55|nr:hypothetical protein [Virgibacillus sp. NKC19-3]MBY7141953.1 hypothetical protein [Virgibacillus sp. NKC19-3]
MLSRYLKFIEQLPDIRELKKEDLMNTNFLIEKENNLKMYYSPHNEYVNNKAKIVIVGITPGWTQMKKAFETFITLDRERKWSTTIMLKETKKAASFSGTMRTNLIYMLDECKLHCALGLPSTRYMFDGSRVLLHTTSLIKFPVFHKNKNYTAHQPKIDNSPLLSKYAYHEFVEEMNSLPNSSLLIPLGKGVDNIINELKQKGRINQVCLTRFPHPSGANGHRVSEFNKYKNYLIDNIDYWARYRKEN